MGWLLWSFRGNLFILLLPLTLSTGLESPYLAKNRIFFIILLPLFCVIIVQPTHRQPPNLILH